MKQLTFLIFFIVFAGIYFLGSWYVYSRGMQALPKSIIRTVFPYVFWILSASFVIGQFLERTHFNPVSQAVTFIGSFGLVMLWYLLIFVVFIDLVRLSNHWFQYIPSNWHTTFLQGKWLFTAVVSSTVILVISGHINAITPKINQVDVYIDKTATSQKEYKIALVTDIHMGFIIGNNRVKRMINKINEENPDIVLLGGDLVDHNPTPVIEKGMGKNFSQLKAPLGIYAVTGNHEFMGSPDISLNYLSQFGIKYLRDTAINVNNEIWLAGRDDKDKPRFTGESRKTIAAILKNTDTSKPILLIDHQPVDYGNAEKYGVDLMVSGHTHKGQFWPFGYITNKMFENDYGLLKKNNSHFYTSSGFGTWGPPVRIGNRPEIVIFNIKLK